MTNITKIRKYKYKQSSRLFASSNFVIGIGSIFNITGNYFEFNYSKTGFEADNKAIKRDWEIIGQELNNAIPVLSHE